MKQKAILAILSLVAIFILAACTAQVQKTVQVEKPQIQQPAEPAAPSAPQATAPAGPASDSTAIPADTSNPALGSDTIKNTVGEVNPAPDGQVSAPVKEFTMSAKKWEFNPPRIEVNKGDSVVLKITSTDVAHGFNLPDFNIREDLNPGQEVTIRFVADKTGTFNFYCDIFCGAGHREMTGELIVR